MDLIGKYDLEFEGLEDGTYLKIWKILYRLD